jgi:hypothetical protein
MVERLIHQRHAGTKSAVRTISLPGVFLARFTGAAPQDGRPTRVAFSPAGRRSAVLAGLPGQRFDCRRDQTLGIALALCGKVDNSFGDNERQAVGAVRKAELMKHRVVSDVQPGYVIRIERETLLPKR